MNAGQPSGRFRMALRAAAILLIVAAVACGGAYLHWTRVQRRFCTVTPGQVYRSGAMPQDRLETVVRKYGIKTVIDFRNPGQEKSDDPSAVDREQRTLAALGVQHVRLPSGQIPADETVRRFLDVMADPAARPVLMHCHHGEGRAVLFAAIYRIEFEHWAPDDARRASKLITWGGTFAADGAKGRYLLGYAPRMLRATNTAPALAAP